MGKEALGIGSGAGCDALGKEVVEGVDVVRMVF